MPVNPVHTDNAPAAIGAYSQATLAEGFLFTSGQLGLVPATGALAEGVEGSGSTGLRQSRGDLCRSGHPRSATPSR